jgi:hypothetical protein
VTLIPEEVDQSLKKSTILPLATDDGKAISHIQKYDAKTNTT